MPWVVRVEIVDRPETYAQGVAAAIESELRCHIDLESRVRGVYAVLVPCESKRRARYLERRIPALFDRHEGLRVRLEATA